MKRLEKAVSVDRTTVLTHALAETARRLDLGPTEIGKIVGVSQPTASRLLKGEYLLKESGKEWELSAHLIRLYRSLSRSLEVMTTWPEAGCARRTKPLLGKNLLR